ncbi:MAG TPA: hypothetical protein VIX91_21775 [Candidatus Acidoferrum sp.]
MRGVFQVDGWGWVKTPVTYVALTHQADIGSAHAEWRIFGIYYNDDRPLLKTDNRPAAAKATDLGGINIGTYGGHFILAFIHGFAAAIPIRAAMGIPLTTPTAPFSPFFPLLASTRAFRSSTP